eukprot:CAMPEP_0170605448 /NCGR_PEP_ID=MMETSP0224-20130122/19979_1 /TAXON_ID=285029 /ORGANISM="Togula jolla, Strain CCCM 725" /LENGTH=392 /DNA_ID=CAMNT_0010930453 /DNA_START=39 /DNA_END=1217 /DNA_ORIENTATION=+
MGSASGEGKTLPLTALQGTWIASRGEVIEVQDANLVINGKPMQGGLKVSPDGLEVVGFSIYHLADGKSLDEVTWQAGYQEIIWRRPKEGEARARGDFHEAQLAAQGSGRAASANTGGQAWGIESEREAVARLNGLIRKWREGSLTQVRSCNICPDWSNRLETGLSVDHVHYVATMMAKNGFKSRRRGLSTAEGAHDVPVLVRESQQSELGKNAVRKWREAIAENPGFPPFMLEGKDTIYCSLGNGHFSQALNLFRACSQNLWTGEPYLVGEDCALREALNDGVESVVLSPDTPLADRRFISEMLNKANGRNWVVGDDGFLQVDDEGAAAMADSQFIALSKVLDAEELSCLVRQKLSLDVNGNVIDRSEDFEDGRCKEPCSAEALDEQPRSRL